MSPRHDADRLRDVLTAVRALEGYRRRGRLEDDDLIFDACRIRLIEIGEAAKALSGDLLSREPSVPWREITRMRDHLTHRYFDTQREIVARVVDRDLSAVADAAARLLAWIEGADAAQTQLDLGDRPADDAERPERSLPGGSPMDEQPRPRLPPPPGVS